MCKSIKAETSNKKTIIVFDGFNPFNMKLLNDLLSGIAPTQCTGKSQHALQVINECITEIDGAFVQSANKQKERPFYEIINEKKARRGILRPWNC